MADTEQKYYYFYNGREIRVLPFEVNHELNPLFLELTAEQREFYDNNPTASVIEVQDCKLMGYPAKGTVDSFGQYKLEAQGKLQGVLSEKIAEVGENNYKKATICYLLDEKDNVYTKNEAEEILRRMLEITTNGEVLYQSAVAALEKAATQEEVDVVVGNYKKDMANI